MRRVIIGVVGGAAADEATSAKAYALGGLIAREGWILLNGGRRTGVMDASARGARDGGGLSIGILYDDDPELASSALDIVIPTGLGSGRNIINVLASDVVIACRGTGGTLSEIALALRVGRPVVLLDFDPGEKFLSLGGSGKWRHAATPEEAVSLARDLLTSRGRLPTGA
jgi:uncharacterized protein (TIGR00725 family)